MRALRAKVAVVSPQPVVREGFTAMLARHSDRLTLIRLSDSVDDEEPDVVLYDVLGLATGDGGDLDRLVKETAAVVLAVGRDLRPDLLTQALGRGADGFFSLGISEPELLAAIESATTGWKPTDNTPDPVIGSSESAQRAQILGADAGLTPREARILALIAQGLSNDAIAKRDFLSINSVKSYIRGAYAKIGAHSRSQAVAWAIKHGFDTRDDWVQPDEPGPHHSG